MAISVRLPLFALLLPVFLVHLFGCGIVQAATPIIKANDTSNAVTITDAASVSVTISLTDIISESSADWWVVASTPLAPPDHLYFYNGTGWTTSTVVAFQQPLIAVNSLEVLTLPALPAGIYTFYFGVDLEVNGSLDLGSLSYSSVELTVTETIPLSAGSCGTETNLFTVSPLMDDAFFEIDPLGATNPPGHTFPTQHTYMMLSDKNLARDVVSPGSITITQVNRVENLSSGVQDYSINFSPCPEVTGYFDHMSSLANVVSNQLGEYANCQQYFAGTEEYRFCYQFTAIDVESGQLLGTAGGVGPQGSAALDFGLRDSRIAPLHFSNPDRLINPDQVFVVCPFDYFGPGAPRTDLIDKLSAVRTDSPVCGRVDFDVDGSFQGRWYLQNSSDFGEQNHIALVPSNKAPATTGVLSIGNADVGIDAYYFDYEDAGFVNRRFDELNQLDTVYCWDRLRDRESSVAGGNSQPINGILFIKLVNEGNLLLQRSTQLDQCPVDSNTLVFTSNATAFER